MQTFSRFGLPLLIVCLFIGQVAMAQTNFQNALGSSSEDEMGVSGVQLTNVSGTVTGYATLSQRYSDNFIPRMWLSFLNANGSQGANLHLDISSDYNDLPHYFQKTFNGNGVHNGYIIVGETQVEQNTTYDIFLTKTDLTGSIQWSYRYGTTTSSEVGMSVQNTMDGGFGGGRHNDQRQ